MNVIRVMTDDDREIVLPAAYLDAGLVEHAYCLTGHAMQGELKTLQSIARPEHFIPVHGEFRHLTHHARRLVSQDHRRP